MTNAEGGTRNAEQQGQVERPGPVPRMMFRVPASPFRVLIALFRLNVAEELQYRANFVASLLGTLFWIGTALLTLAVFFRHTTRLGDWDYWEVVVLLGVFNTLTGVIEAVLRPGIGRLAGEVKNGGLDLVLAKPVDAQGFVSFRRLDVWRFTDVLLGLALAGYALARLHHVPTLAQVAATWRRPVPEAPVRPRPDSPARSTCQRDLAPRRAVRLHRFHAYLLAVMLLRAGWVAATPGKAASAAEAWSRDEITGPRVHRHGRRRPGPRGRRGVLRGSG